MCRQRNDKASPRSLCLGTMRSAGRASFPANCTKGDGFFIFSYCFFEFKAEVFRGEHIAVKQNLFEFLDKGDYIFYLILPV